MGAHGPGVRDDLGSVCISSFLFLVTFVLFYANYYLHQRKEDGYQHEEVSSSLDLDLSIQLILEEKSKKLSTSTQCDESAQESKTELFVQLGTAGENSLNSAELAARQFTSHLKDQHQGRCLGKLLLTQYQTDTSILSFITLKISN